MQLEAEDVRYIRSKRRIYLVLFFLGIFARIAEMYMSYQEMNRLEPSLTRLSHNFLGFLFLNLVLTIAFLTQFLPAAKRAGYSTWLESSLILFMVLPSLMPIPFVGLISFFIILVVDQSLYKMLKKAS